MATLEYIRGMKWFVVCLVGLGEENSERRSKVCTYRLKLYGICPSFKIASTKRAKM